MDPEKSLMNSSKKKHPSRQQLADFVNGRIAPRHQGKMERHLERCTECVNKLDSIKHDTLGDRLIAVATCFDREIDSGDRSEEIPAGLINHERYEILERIGVGGMGDVYRARQRSMDRLVAIKVLRRSLFENDRAVARFHNEIKVAARLNHPNIVHSYDADITDGLNLLVMELVEGAKLSDYVKDRGSLTPREAALITTEIAKGLNYASQQGMIHRDIKPQNIMVLEDQSVKITDFGLAKFMLANSSGDDGSLTMEGEVFGTPDYIAPEQIRDSGTADTRSDIYSLGCTLYFMLSGRPPFLEFSVGEKLAGHLEKEPRKIADLCPALPAGLAGLIECMMEKDVSARCQSYDQIIAGLQPFCDAESLDSDVVKAPAVETETSNATAIDLGEPLTLRQSPSAVSSRQASHSRPSRLPTRRIALAGLGVVGVGGLLVATGLVPNPLAFFERDLRIAIVIPAKKAYYPEIEGLFQALSQQPGVEIEFLAETVGRVGYSSFNGDSQKPGKFNIERTLADISTSEIDGVIFTGGWDNAAQSPESTRYAFDKFLNDQAKILINQLLSEQKPVASICGGTVVLANAGILRGLRVANCRYISDEIKTSSGANWSEELEQDKHAIVVQDGLVVTGGNSINANEIVEKVLSLARESRQH